MTKRRKRNNLLITLAEKSQDPSSTLENAIRKRAFELYRERGNADGYATEDWLRAEAEVLAARGK